VKSQWEVEREFMLSLKVKEAECGGSTGIIPALRKQRQKDCKLKASLDYIARFCLKNTKQTKKRV
jgi:hypothetical protein